MLPSATVDAIVEGRHGDPFAVLGVHEADGRIVVRAFVPGAATVDVVTRDGATLAPLSRRPDAGFFEGVIPASCRREGGASDAGFFEAVIPRRTAYRLRAAHQRGAWLV